jgi:alkanesulfonate monooxygenase SsuD/methylene tetrahydromethanopterin reductase-like flavin-dependent oxidoreductase (luciferase family)
VIAAGGPRAARFAREKGDGLMATEPRKDIIEAFGRQGPRYAEVAMCCAKREDEARATAHKYFRWSLAGWPVQAELPNPKGFAAASKHIAPEAVADKLRPICGAAPSGHPQVHRGGLRSHRSRTNWARPGLFFRPLQIRARRRAARIGSALRHPESRTGPRPVREPDRKKL